MNLLPHLSVAVTVKRAESQPQNTACFASWCAGGRNKEGRARRRDIRQSHGGDEMPILSDCFQLYACSWQTGIVNIPCAKTELGLASAGDHFVQRLNSMARDPPYLLLEDGSWVTLITFDKVDKVVHICRGTEAMVLVDRRATLYEVMDICASSVSQG